MIYFYKDYKIMKKHIQYAALLLAIAAANPIYAESIEQFNYNYYTKICTGIIACADDVSIAENLQLSKITGVESCVSFFTKRDDPQKWLLASTQKSVMFQPNNTESCLTAITALSCKALGRRLAKPAAIKGCENVFVGTIDDFESCSLHLECKSSDAQCYGTCERPRPLQCGDSLCNDQEFCDTQNNSCQIVKAVGESCSNFSECENSNCADGICKAPRPVVKPGGQCGKDYGHICSIGEFCDENNCVPYRKKGESCSTDYEQFKECEAPFECMENKCG